MKKRNHVLATIATTFLTASTLLFSTTALSVTDYDVNGDNSINMADVVRLNLFIAEMPSEEKIQVSDLNNDGLVTNEDTVLLLKYLAEMENTTTTTETTTTTTGTTTTQITTTETTTISAETTTSTTVNENAHIEFLQTVLQEMAAQEEIPALNDDTYVQGDGVFFFEYNETIYAYTRLTKQPDAPVCFDVFPYYVDAFHVWEYHGDTEVSFEIPNHDGLQFQYNGDTYTYSLHAEVDAGDVKSIANTLFDNTWNWYDIQHNDYDLDGQLTVNDLKIAIMLSGQDIIDFKRSVAEWVDFMEGFWNRALTPPAISDNFVLHFYSDFQEYSFVAPPYYLDDCYFYNGFYQVLPASYYEQLYEEFGPPVTDGGDYILYNMVDGWTTWSEKTEIAWAWVTPLDNNGDYLSERYEDPNIDF